MRSIVATVALLAMTAAIGACSSDGDSSGTPSSRSKESSTAAPVSSMTVNSAAFSEGSAIPVKYSCEGENVSPPLAWSGAPSGTAALALVVDDPDAPSGTFVHWVVVNMPADVDHLREGATGLEQLANGAGKTSWTGPCPPSGPAHHYRFAVYALPKTIAGADTRAAIRTIRETALAHGILVGTFQR